MIPQVLSGERRWCVVNADNREVLPTIPDKGVDHVITDPPYSERIHATARTNKGRIPGQEAPHYSFGFDCITEAEIAQVGPMMARIAGRWIMVFSDMEESPVLWRANMGTATFVRMGIWDKPGATPQLSGDRPGVAGEAINIFHRHGRKRWNGGGAHGIWRHPVPRGDDRPEHKTPKPLSLMLELVSLFTDPDDIVLDPFAGSFTTGVACLRLGRRFIGIEREKKWTDLGLERMQAEVEGSTLQARRNGQVPLFGRTA